MNYARPWQSYQVVTTQTAPPGQLVSMLYDGVLRFLEQALNGFNFDDPLECNQTIHNNIYRAQQILAELDASLDLQRGGELAQTLHRLYDYLDGRLTESNLKKQPEGIRETIQRITVLRDAWRQMLAGQTEDAAGIAPARASLSACV